MDDKEELLDEVKNKLVNETETSGEYFEANVVVKWKKIEQVIDQLKSDD